MTFIIETTPAEELLLQQEAKRRGLSTAQLAQSLFEETLRDLEDDDRTAHILEKTDPEKWRSLDELRKTVRA